MVAGSLQLSDSGSDDAAGTAAVPCPAGPRIHMSRLLFRYLHDAMPAEIVKNLL
jgi:hypothetical protein